MRERRLCTTALSHQSVELAWRRLPNALARSSQGVLRMLALATAPVCLTGCLIADAPDYGDPRRTPPVIDHLSIEPKPIYRITARPGDPPREFAMTVRSEDAGEALYAVPVLNFGTERQELRVPTGIPARAADEPKTVRVVLDLDALLPAGCHTVTIMVMHTSSFGASLENESDDVASVTWWVDALTPVDDEVKPCPTFMGM